jgi:hypothetical protein
VVGFVSLMIICLISVVEGQAKGKAVTPARRGAQPNISPGVHCFHSCRGEVTGEHVD